MASKKKRALDRSKPGYRTKPGPTAPPARTRTSEPGTSFPVVGLGASAGGLAALQEFFSNMPAKSGMAFVVVTHQHVGQPSLLPELLGRKTAMPIVTIVRPTTVKPDHVYLAKPGHNVSIERGVLHAKPVPPSPPLNLAIDCFFRSLALDQKDRAIGIVLSGTGSDGSNGLREIKAALGLVLVQHEKSAAYSGMPLSAVATGVADYVLAPADMPRRLLAYAGALGPARLDPLASELQQVFGLLRKRTGHDFSGYKSSTLLRRIERRINLHHLEGIDAYVPFLIANPGEIDLLFKELLIGVTSFFRDPDAFAALEAALKELVAAKPEGEVLRAWIAGCSTGEEAYTIAILLREIVEALGRAPSVQIFATDLDVDAINEARAGVFSAAIATVVSAERLARFFTREDETYRVRKELREMIIFAPQNVIADPPFTKLDVLSCRNLLIYLDAKVQRRLIPLFHYALKPRGVLFLGSSESIGGAELFAPLDKKWKIFRRKEVPPGTYAAEFPSGVSELTVAVERAAAAPPAVNLRADTSFVSLADKLLLRELVPPTAFVHEDGELLHIHGRMGLFLEPAPGPQANPNILTMAREGLELELSAALRQSVAESRDVTHHGVRVRTNGGFHSTDLRVRRVHEPEALRGLYMISFENVRATPKPGEPAPKDAPPDRIAELERELQYTKESHQTTIEQLETANEELKSTNEELQSTNEELQSANEELETSKEEMQSLNEELQTVNAELERKVEELSRTNDDMRNLLNATEIATIFLDNDLNIKRYTEQARSVIRLIPSDVGRAIGDLVSSLHHNLVEDARDVLRTLVFKELEVQGDKGTWYLMRIMPYRTTENVIDGLVLTFVDITKTKALEDNQRRLLAVLVGSPTAIFEQDRHLRFTWAGSKVAGHAPAEVVGKTDADIFGVEQVKALAEAKRSVLATGEVTRRQLRLGGPGGEKSFDLYAQPVRDAAGAVVGVSCVLTDLTPRA